MIVQKLLNLLPNLEFLELNSVEITSLKEEIKWDLKLTKIERIKILGNARFGNFLESLEKCTIKEADFTYFSRDSEVVQKFLKSQKKNLRKLTAKSDHNLSNDLKDLRLEHLEYNYCGTNHISLEFLKHLVNLKFLILLIPFFSNEIFKMICELKDLEILELDGLEGSDNSGLNNLNKLEKLKRLKVSNGLSWNVLDHLQFGVFNDLEELDASFSGPSI
jgi:hypothetical protein